MATGKRGPFGGPKNSPTQNIWIRGAVSDDIGKTVVKNLPREGSVFRGDTRRSTGADRFAPKSKGK